MYKYLRKLLLTGVLAMTLCGLSGCGSSINVPKGHIGFQVGPVSFTLPDNDVWVAQNEDSINVYSDSKVKIFKVPVNPNNKGNIAVQIDLDMNKPKTSENGTLTTDILEDCTPVVPTSKEKELTKDRVVVIRAIYPNWEPIYRTAKITPTKTDIENDKELGMPHYVIALSDGVTSYFYVFTDKKAFEEATVDPSLFGSELELLATDGSSNPNQDAAQIYHQRGQDKLQNIDNALKELEIYTDGVEVENTRGFFGSTYRTLKCNTLVNNTDKNIKELKIAFVAFDHNGKWTNFHGPSGRMGPTFYGPVWYANMKSLYSDEFIVPANSSKNGGTTTVHNTMGYFAAVKSIVKEATFEDGSVWENPLYDVWYEKYAEKDQPELSN